MRSGASPTQGLGASARALSKMSKASRPTTSGRGPARCTPTRTTPWASGVPAGRPASSSDTTRPAPPSSTRGARSSSGAGDSGDLLSGRGQLALGLSQLGLQHAAQQLAGVVVGQNLAELPDLGGLGGAQARLDP